METLRWSRIQDYACGRSALAEFHMTRTLSTQVGMGSYVPAVSLCCLLQGGLQTTPGGTWLRAFFGLQVHPDIRPNFPTGNNNERWHMTWRSRLLITRLSLYLKASSNLANSTWGPSKWAIGTVMKPITSTLYVPPSRAKIQSLASSPVKGSGSTLGASKAAKKLLQLGCC